MLIKINNRKNINTKSTAGLCEKSIPSKIFISLKNIPNGGMPEIARKAKRKIQPVFGNKFKTAATFETSLDLYLL